MTQLDALGWALAGVPWLLPTFLLALVAAVPMAPAVARRLGIAGPVAWLLLAGVALVGAATLTPGSPAVTPQPRPLTCDTTRLGLASLGTYLAIDEYSLNVLLFVPLGFAAALVGRPPRPLIAALILLPVAVEATQSVVVVLGRACQTGDVVDNWLGLAAGAAPALALRRLIAAVD